MLFLLQMIYPLVKGHANGATGWYSSRCGTLTATTNPTSQPIMKINEINDHVLLSGRDRLEVWNKGSTRKSIANVNSEVKTDSEVMKIIVWCEMKIVFYKYGFLCIYDKDWKRLVQKGFHNGDSIIWRIMLAEIASLSSLANL